MPFVDARVEVRLGVNFHIPCAFALDLLLQNVLLELHALACGRGLALLLKFLGPLLAERLGPGLIAFSLFDALLSVLDHLLFCDLAVRPLRLRADELLFKFLFDLILLLQLLLQDGSGALDPFWVQLALLDSLLLLLLLQLFQRLVELLQDLLIFHLLLRRSAALELLLQAQRLRFLKLRLLDLQLLNLLLRLK